MGKYGLFTPMNDTSEGEIPMNDNHGSQDRAMSAETPAVEITSES